jgi:hypothetical protein
MAAEKIVRLQNESGAQHEHEAAHYLKSFLRVKCAQKPLRTNVWE